MKSTKDAIKESESKSALAQTTLIESMQALDDATLSNDDISSSGSGLDDLDSTTSSEKALSLVENSASAHWVIIMKLKIDCLVQKCKYVVILVNNMYVILIFSL